MSRIAVQATAEIHDGRLEDFKEVAHACVSLVRKNETGTLRYDWFLTADGKRCVVREEYEDSNAVLAHFANIGGLLQRMQEAASVHIEVFGEVSEELGRALAGVPHTRYHTLVAL